MAVVKNPDFTLEAIKKCDFICAEIKQSEVINDTKLKKIIKRVLKAIYSFEINCSIKTENGLEADTKKMVYSIFYLYHNHLKEHYANTFSTDIILVCEELISILDMVYTETIKDNEDKILKANNKFWQKNQNNLINIINEI